VATRQIAVLAIRGRMDLVSVIRPVSFAKPSRFDIIGVAHIGLFEGSAIAYAAVTE